MHVMYNACTKNGETMKAISITEYINAICDFYESGVFKTQRLGQYLVNTFNLDDEQELFYEEDAQQAITIFSKYLD